MSDGRFEIYLDGQKVYDRKQSKEEDFVPTLRVLRKTVPQLVERLNAAVTA